MSYLSPLAAQNVQINQSSGVAQRRLADHLAEIDRTWYIPQPQSLKRIQLTDPDRLYRSSSLAAARDLLSQQVSTIHDWRSGHHARNRFTIARSGPAHSVSSTTRPSTINRYRDAGHPMNLIDYQFGEALNGLAATAEAMTQYKDIQPDTRLDINQSINIHFTPQNTPSNYSWQQNSSSSTSTNPLVNRTSTSTNASYMSQSSVYNATLATTPVPAASLSPAPPAVPAHNYKAPPPAPKQVDYSSFDPNSFLQELDLAVQEDRQARASTPGPDSTKMAGYSYSYTAPQANTTAAPKAKSRNNQELIKQLVRPMKSSQDQHQTGDLTYDFMYSKYTCANCQQTIAADKPGCTALNQTYHIDCFICSTCNVKLAGGSFYAVDGKPYCEKDYMETLEKCALCSKPIMEKILRATGKAYHPACFKCVTCQKLLDGVPFTVDAESETFCVPCFHEKYAPRCAVCSKPIIPEEGKDETFRVVAMDKSYHVECYKCEDCSMKLSSKVEGAGCYPLDEHLYCKNCNADRVRKLAQQA